MPACIPLRQHLVVDSNAQSTPDFEAALRKARAGAPAVLIPDALFLEIFRSQASSRYWLQALAPFDGAFAVARPPGTVIRSELGNDKPARLINDEGTAKLRSFIRDWSQRGDAAFEEIAPDVESTQRQTAKGSLADAAFIRSTATPAHGVITELLNAELVAQLKSSKTSEADKKKVRCQLVATDSALYAIACSMAQDEFETSRFVELVQQPTYVRAAALLTIANTLYDAEHGRTPDSLSGKKAVNDVIDGQAVLIAALCEGLLTKDKRSRLLLELIRAGLGAPPARFEA